MTDEPAAPVVDTPAPAVADSVLGAASTPPADSAANEPGKEGGAAPAATPFDVEKFTAPEGLELSDADKTFMVDAAKKHGLSQEAMTDLMTEYGSRLKNASESSVQAFQQLNETWQNEVKADKEIGGDKLPEVVQTIGKVLDDPRYADPDVKKWLTYTGAGNNPAIVRTFYKMAKALTEGGHVAGAPPAQAAAKPTGAQALYPSLPSGA